jgi:2-polyprenyl-6-methoxyphenol hydroxylase-like FAD-dependent oxidoreductase
MDLINPNGLHDERKNGSLNGWHKEKEPKPLNIAIVGAGIGGLSAAIFLRRQGHHVTIFEQSSFANELGAAVHLAPNATGLLKRMGLDAEAGGANETLSMAQYMPDGKALFHIDLTKHSSMWQHKWLLAHRVHLHSDLKRLATTTDGKGRPAELRTSSKIVDVDPAGTVMLASGEQFSADVIIGADGVHSRTREKVPGSENVNTFGSGKSAFRFMIDREKALADPETKRWAEQDGHLTMVFARDRRIVIYPTSNNELLNFVCIHPTNESEVNDDAAGEWNHVGHKDKLLEVYKDFDPTLVKMLDMADEGTLKVWTLLDMKQLPTWTEKNLLLIGDAAHPFTPYQGQGAGQAIEDAASLAVMLPLGVPIEEISERLKLYEKCRYERASRIQEYSRIVGRDLGDGPPLDAATYTGYNFGHDEWDYSSQRLREWMWARKPNLYWRMPIAFGPMPGPRQSFGGDPRNGEESTFVTASIRFKTSRTVLQNLFSTPAFKFSSPATMVYATFSVTTLDNLAWLGGRGYSHFGLHIHDIEYEKPDAEKIKGSYLPVLFENLADPVLIGREELGMPKLWCEMNVKNDTETGAWKLNASWLGADFAHMDISSLQEVPSEQDSQSTATQSSQGLIWYKTFPQTGSATDKTDRMQRGSDSSYTVCLSDSKEAKINRKIDKTWSGIGKIQFDALDWKSLPTLHHIVERLREIPVYDVVEAKVLQGRGVGDVVSARQIG